MAILWHNDPRGVERYSMAVGESLHQVESASMASRVLTADHSERLVIIGPDVDLEHACDLAEITRVERPEVGIILLRRRIDVTMMSQALRAGIREVVPADDLTAIAEACRHSRDLTQKLVGGTGQPGGARGPYRHRLLREGWRGQDHLLDQPRRLPRRQRQPHPAGRPGPRLRRRGDQSPAAAGTDDDRRGGHVRPPRRPGPRLGRDSTR